MPPVAEASVVVQQPAVGHESAVALAEAPPATENLPRDAGAELKWNEVITRVNQKKRMLGAFLEESRFGGMTEQGLAIETDGLHSSVIEEKENRAIVAEALRDVFGHPVAFRCVPPSADAPVRALRTNADVQPMIDRALALFDGEKVEPRRPEATARPTFRKEKPTA